ncbi:MAG: MFS transporter [Chloroflexota bacterium]
MSAAEPAESGALRPLHRDRNFALFWAGQTLSALGDAFGLIAVPLLVLEITGSLAMMGLVTALHGVGSLIAGIFGGPIVDRADRRKLMIRCDLARFVLYLLIPLGWLLFGPQLWLVFAVTVLGAGLQMVFGIGYITAVANLVDRSRITEANGRLGASYSLAFALGPVLAGLVASRFGAAAAIGVDAFTFLASAASLGMIQLRRAAAVRPEDDGGRRQEFLAGVTFLFATPLFRWLTFITGGMAFFATGIHDLLIYYVKQDLAQPPQVVGLVFGVASIGAIASGLLLARMRRSLGYGVCYVGGLLLQGAALLLIGVAPAVAIIAALATVSAFGDATRGMLTMTLRQELTPDHLLGRVTAAFWTIFSVPGPLGALALTQFGERVGTPVALSVAGAFVAALGILALFSPMNAREPLHARPAE